MITTGSTVRLISGGPKMSVKSINGHSVITQWFDGQTLQEQTFHITALREDISESNTTSTFLLG